MNVKTRKAVYEKYDGHCAYCGREIELKDMEVDHFHPKEKPYQENGVWLRGDDRFENLMPSCRRCNHYKRQNRLETFRHYLLDMKHKVLDDTYLGKVAMDYGMVEWKGWDGKFYFERQEAEPK